MSEEKQTKVVEEVPATTEVVAEDEMAAVLPDHTGPVVTMKKLLEAGVHFGHQTRKWNPKMAKYIYGARNGIYILDLNKSIDKITEAYEAMKNIVEQGGKVLFVGTKKQVQEVVVEEATRSGSFYINNRWLGGTLTNFKTIQSRIRYLKDLESQQEEGIFDLKPKKEVAILLKEKEKLSKNLEGIKEMRKVPNAIVVTDPLEENIAVLEAKKLRIPVFGIVDTNVDPDNIDYQIPANDDAIRSVKLVVQLLADAIVEAKGGLPVVAYTKDEGEEATMRDAIRQADKLNEEKLAALRAARKEKEERFAKQRALREKRYMEGVSDVKIGNEVKKEVKPVEASKPVETAKPVEAKKVVKKPVEKKVAEVKKAEKKDEE